MKKVFASLILSLISLGVYASNEFTVMHGPGGVSDIVTRFLTKEFSDKTYNVQNRPGAAGRIAIRHLMSENTIMLATMVQVYATNPLNFKDLEYNPNTDLEVIATIGVMPSALICNKKTGLETIKDFRSNTKRLTFGVGGFGSSEHVATEVLLSQLVTKHTVVPFAQGGSTAIKDLLGGHIDCMFGNYPTIKSHIENQEVTLLLTSHDLGLPVPTWSSEFGNAFPFQSYLSVIGSTKMPAELKNKIRKDFSNSFSNPGYNDRLKALGVFPKSSIKNQDITQSLQNIEYIKNFLIDNKIRISQ
jgi:tripartite-type tricarboxylate transporter receptor subunit TctC